MTILDARASIVGFDMSSGVMVAFETYLSYSDTHYSWATEVTGDPENYIHAYGAGITADPGTQYPTAARDYFAEDRSGA